VKKLDLGRTSTSATKACAVQLGWSAEENVVNYFRFWLEQEKFVASDDEASGWHKPLPRAAGFRVRDDRRNFVSALGMIQTA